MPVVQHRFSAGAEIGVPIGVPGTSVTALTGIPRSPFFLKYLNIGRNALTTPGTSDVTIQLWGRDPTVLANLNNHTFKFFEETLPAAQTADAWDRNSAAFSGSVGTVPAQSSIAWVVVGQPLTTESVVIDGSTIQFLTQPAPAVPDPFLDPAYTGDQFDATGLLIAPRDPFTVVIADTFDHTWQNFVLVANRLGTRFTWAYNTGTNTITVTESAEGNRATQEQFAADAAFALAAITNVGAATATTGSGGASATLWLRMQTTDAAITNVFVEIGLGDSEADE